MKYTKLELENIKKKICDNVNMTLLLTYRNRYDIRQSDKVILFTITPKGFSYANDLFPEDIICITRRPDASFDFGTPWGGGYDHEFKVVQKEGVALCEVLEDVLDDLEDPWEKGYYTWDQISIIKKEIFDSPYFNLYIKYFGDWERGWCTRSIKVFTLGDLVVEVGDGRNSSRGGFNTEDLIEFGDSTTFFVKSKITNENIPLSYFFDPKYRGELSRHKYVRLSDIVEKLLIDLDSCENCTVRALVQCKPYDSKGATDCRNAITKYLENLYEL